MSIVLTRQESSMSTSTTDSISFSSDEELAIFPITDIDGFSSEHDEVDEDDNSEARDEVYLAPMSYGPSLHDKNITVVEEKPKALMSLRQRRMSRALAVAEAIKPLSNTRRLWFNAIRKAKRLADPWMEFHIEDLRSELALRHRYNALKKTWTTDKCYIKIESRVFNRGALRQCYRLKKLSSFAINQDWKHASNYVAKKYIEEDVPRETYWEDVRLQMDAKLWGEEYNRHNPPKKVDIFQMYILEFVEREGSPLYHLEHFIEGEYIKYNSNSGFVEENVRLTPQAFSHFTFERSGHELIIVDIQGCGDLYTDPQIHTAKGIEYGDGNLGAKGFALFFHSHICNTICHSLGLSAFDMAPIERFSQKPLLRRQMSAKTTVRGRENLCFSPSPNDCIDLTRFLGRQRSNSSMTSFSSNGESPVGSPSAMEEDTTDEDPISPDISLRDSPLGNVRMRMRYGSVSESDTDTMTELRLRLMSHMTPYGSLPKDNHFHNRQEEERAAFARFHQQTARPSCINNEINLLNLNALANRAKIGDSVLGNIHHEMAKYHELGRFAESETEINWEAAIFHEEYAAQLGVMEAILTLAKLYLGLPRNVLQTCTIEDTEDHKNQGVDYMAQAADAGDRGAIIFIARAFETGNGLGSKRARSWEDAIEWYEQAVNTVEDMDEGGEYDGTMDDPLYQLQAKMADMLRYGGHDLDKDPQRAAELYNEAAEGAMAAMKGRLANKYYMVAEECYGEVDEGDENQNEAE